MFYKKTYHYHCRAAAPFYAPEIHSVTVSNQTIYWAVYDATDIETGLMAIGAAWSMLPTGTINEFASLAMVRNLCCVG